MPKTEVHTSRIPVDTGMWRRIIYAKIGAGDEFMLQHLSHYTTEINVGGCSIYEYRQQTQFSSGLTACWANVFLGDFENFLSFEQIDRIIGLIRRRGQTMRRNFRLTLLPDTPSNEFSDDNIFFARLFSKDVPPFFRNSPISPYTTSTEKLFIQKLYIKGSHTFSVIIKNSFKAIFFFRIAKTFSNT